MLLLVEDAIPFPITSPPPSPHLPPPTTHFQLPSPSYNSAVRGLGGGTAGTEIRIVSAKNSKPSVFVLFLSSFFPPVNPGVS